MNLSKLILSFMKSSEHLKINKEERKDIITKVFDDKVSKEVMNFMKILIDKRRGTAISSIYNEYVDMLDDHKGVVKAVVESAVPLTDEEQKALTENWLRSLDEKFT